MAKKSRKAFAKYTRVVAVKGSSSAAAQSIRDEQKGDEDFGRLARLTDFIFERFQALKAEGRRKAPATV